MVEKSIKKWFAMPAGIYCGVFIEEKTAKKLQKILYRQSQEIKEFLQSNKENLLAQEWTLAYPNGKQTIIHYSNSEGAEKLEQRIKLFDKANMLSYVENGVFLTDKSFNDASSEVKRFYEKYYSPEPPKE